MVKAQEWLNEKCPKEQRANISILNISNKNLEDQLVLELREFPNLEELDFSSNQITKIIFVGSYAKTRLAKKQRLEWKLKKLNLSNNNFEQDLTFLGDLINLEELNLANNKFFGSLEPLRNMAKLGRLDISDTDISEGLKYLSTSLKKIKCSSETKEAKVKFIERIIKACGFMEDSEGEGVWLIDKQVLNEKLNEEENQKLCQAAENNDVKTIKDILSNENFIVNLKDKQGNTALHYAVSNGSWEAMKILLQNKADPDVKDEDGFTSLHIAVGKKRWDMVNNLLFQAKANPNVKDNEGNTPMHFAAEGNDLMLLGLLKEEGGDINAKNIYDWTVLHSAASGLIKTAGTDKDWEIIKWLLQKNVNTDVETKSGLEVQDVLIEIGSSYVEKYEKMLNYLKKQEALVEYKELTRHNK